MVGRLDPTPTFVFTLPPAPTIAWRSPWRQTRYVKGGVCCRQPSIIIWQSNPYPLSRLSMHVCLVVYRMITSMCIPISSAALGRISLHCAPPTHRLLFWHFALSELRSTSTGYEQTSDRLHSRVNTDENTERQQGVIDEPLFARLGACLEVEQRRVNETKRDTDMSSDQTIPCHTLTRQMLQSTRQTCPAQNCPPMTAGSRKQRFPLGRHSSAI